MRDINKLQTSREILSRWIIHAYTMFGKMPKDKEYFMKCINFIKYTSRTVLTPEEGRIVVAFPPAAVFFNIKSERLYRGEKKKEKEKWLPVEV